MSEIRVTSIVGENGGDRVGLTTGLTVGPLTGTTGIGATITHQGHAQFAGVCTASSSTVSSGNVVIGTAEKGIDFSAQTPTAVSGATATGEVFDHYEEGTWTATLGNVSAPTYEAQGGVYTRIGRMVFCDCTIGVASGLDTSDGSGFQIRGLPFTGSTTGGTVCLFSLGRYTNLLGGKSTSVRNVRFLGDGVILQEGNDSDIAYNECSSSGYLQISFAYMMA